MNSDHRRMLFALVVVSMAAAIIATPARLRETSSQDVEAARDFQARVSQYTATHRRLANALPPLQVDTDISEVRAAMNALATAIQAERKDARRGDIFTADVSRLFRKRIASSLTAAEWKAILSEGGEGDPLVAPTIAVNGRWPAGRPFGFMPPQLLAALPGLPSELEYRFIGRALVLWDRDADLIVDFIPEAMFT